MVTQPGKEQECKASIESFDSQTFPDRELIIVHDGPTDFHSQLSATIRNYSNADIQIFPQAKQCLGLLRNKSVELANYPYICQWDDDDLSHPSRLENQYAYLQKANADFCFLTDQLHLFSDQEVLFWDDWSVEPYPGNLIQGTILGKRDLLGKYTDLPLGEDTELAFRLVEQDHNIAAMREFGWMYIYTYNGRNAWDLDHHKAISNWKRLKYDALKEKQFFLQRKLLDYALPFSSLSMLHEQGKFTIKL